MVSWLEQGLLRLPRQCKLISALRAGCASSCTYCSQLLCGLHYSPRTQCAMRSQQADWLVGLLTGLPMASVWETNYDSVGTQLQAHTAKEEPAKCRTVIAQHACALPRPFIQHLQRSIAAMSAGGVDISCSLFCARCLCLLLGTPWGQSAVFSQYELEDGTIVTVQGEQIGPSSIEIPPSQEDVAAAEAAVQEQAAAVRALKEGQGLGNQDPQVQQAVAELQQRKSVLTELQEKYQAALREAEAEAAAPPTVESSTEE